MRGGFGGAPKFPPSMVLEGLLRLGDDASMIMVDSTCRAMARIWPVAWTIPSAVFAWSAVATAVCRAWAAVVVTAVTTCCPAPSCSSAARVI